MSGAGCSAENVGLTVSREGCMVDGANPVKVSISLGSDLGVQRNLGRIPLCNPLDVASVRVFDNILRLLFFLALQLSDTTVYEP